MMQLSLIPMPDPPATQEMLEDAGLKRAIKVMRQRSIDSGNDRWPWVKRLCDVVGRPAWLVEDGCRRFVVVNGNIFTPRDFDILDPKVRDEAVKAIKQLDTIDRILTTALNDAYGPA